MLLIDTIALKCVFLQSKVYLCIKQAVCIYFNDSYKSLLTINRDCVILAAIYVKTCDLTNYNRKKNKMKA